MSTETELASITALVDQLHLINSISLDAPVIKPLGNRLTRSFCQKQWAEWKFKLLNKQMGIGTCQQARLAILLPKCAQSDWDPCHDEVHLDEMD